MSLSLPNDQSRPFSVGKDAPKPIITDTEYLIRQAFALDVRRGYQALFQRYYQPLCSHAVRFVYSREVAEDIVSDVFLSFWKNEVHTHITTSFRAYLFTAVRNRAYNHLQEELHNDNTATPLPESADILRTNDDPHQILQLTELYTRINEEVRSLSPQCQRVFMLSRFEGKNHREIANELTISPKTVETHILKALAHL
ncbi:MAG: RNA polymerase sigma-70 factor, partial [Bacteroidetes bacterium]|nr:RNA polymerase sigma-70 factor [Fibrella sp.]